MYNVFSKNFGRFAIRLAEFYRARLTTCSSSPRPGRARRPLASCPPWLEIPSVAEQVGAWSELAGRDLARLATSGDADEITDTAVAQPLLVAAALAVAGLLPEPDAVAGHSVGELAAGAIAGNPLRGRRDPADHRPRRRDGAGLRRHPHRPDRCPRR